MSFFSLALAILILGFEFKSYLYEKHINLFEKIETINGKISRLEYEDILGISYIKFQLNSKEYSIIDDERYVSYRNLVLNDSIKIDIVKKNNKDDVIKIYLISPDNRDQ